MSKSYEVIFENNQQWLETQKQQHPEYFTELADGQNPDFLYIGCSDSRVVAEGLMGLEPGEVFVHRNVANLVNGLDLNAGSAIEYAVSHLKVKHIIVCGHYNCGGIKAAMVPEDMGPLNPWLRNRRRRTIRPPGRAECAGAVPEYHQDGMRSGALSAGRLPDRARLGV